MARDRSAIPPRPRPVLAELEDLQLFTNTAALRTVIGDKLPLLRKIASAGRSRYYTKPGYVAAEQAQQRGWAVPLEGSRETASGRRQERRRSGRPMRATPRG